MTPEEIEAMKAERDSMKAELEKLKAAPPKPPEKQDEDPDLMKKAAEQKAAEMKALKESKALEAAIRFELAAPEWLKTNASLLPKDFPDIFKAAEGQNYKTQTEKDAAIKAGMIKSFFSVQTNVDLLTDGLKVALDEWLKLTNNVRQEQAQQIYSSVFEPAFALLKGQKKAEQLREGGMPPSDAEEAYKQKLMAGARKHYLGEKPNVT